MALYADSRKPAASERVQKHVIDHQPDLLVMGYGLNDVRGGTPLEMFRQELVELIKVVRQECDPLIVLLGPNCVTEFTSPKPWWHADEHRFETFNLVIKQVAESEECLFCEILDAVGCAEWLVGYSRVHPNNLDHRLITHEIFETLARNCSGLAACSRRIEKTADRWRDESALKADYGQ